ncbi:MAG: hypothetical protein KBA26_05670 [Candidatus Delongbacteria bacterium]|nr:hypothetical protein [Candidatus Delongbacteria bacterium]
MRFDKRLLPIVGWILILAGLIGLMLTRDPLHALFHFWLGVWMVMHVRYGFPHRDPAFSRISVFYTGSMLIFIVFLILDIKQNIIGF